MGIKQFFDQHVLMGVVFSVHARNAPEDRAGFSKTHHSVLAVFFLQSRQPIFFCFMEFTVRINNFFGHGQEFRYRHGAVIVSLCHVLLYLLK